MQVPYWAGSYLFCTPIRRTANMPVSVIFVSQELVLIDMSQ